ncbi:MAG: hypothetical protein K2M98_02450, partial [Muribaculum sp.]|nr:hypothetical protein [Muribaculum sp.]
MKKFLSTLILISIAISMPVLFASCDKDEPKPSYQPSQPNQPYEPNEPTENEDKFADLYGYWLNSDKSGAMEIKKYSNTLCKIKYYVYTTSGVKESSSDYRRSGSSFTALTPNGLYNISVSISSSTRNRILLKKEFSYASDLSSYVFTQVDEDEFYSYIEHGNSGNQGNQGNDDNDDDENAKKLIGTWVGKDCFSETYTITFYSSGK